jgi:hypothetical protein
LVEVYYDVQQVRIAAEHRVRRAGEHGLSESGVRSLMDWVDEHMDTQERELKAMILREIRQEPLWRNWLVNVKGVGPCIAGGLMAWLGDCSRFKTVSKVWAFAGMHVVDGEAPKRKRGQQANWNPTLRVLAWKAGKSFVLVGDGYRALYDQEKARLRGLHPEPIPFDPPRRKKDGSPQLRFTDGHLDAMARRKVAKVFLAHYWQKAREQAGLPTRAVYCIEKLGHTTPIPVVES